MPNSERFKQALVTIQATNDVSLVNDVRNGRMSVAAAELQATRQKMEERTCRVGSPRGPSGIVEKVFKGRKTNSLRCKVLMDTGAVRYFDELDVYVA